MLEKQVDQAIVAYAKKRGLLSIKLTMLGTMGFAGLPDRLFLGTGRLVFFIEMKRPGGKMSELQKLWQGRLETLGFHVYECDDIDYGKQIIDYELQPA
jgi:hypothetical protein